MSDDPQEPVRGQNLTDHLTDLRNALVRSAYGLVVGTAVCWFFRQQLFDIVRAPIAPYLEGGKLNFLNPMEAFMANIKLALVGGSIISCPVWLHQAWLFIAPGLYSNEKKYTALFISTGTALFCAGVAFVYFLVFPAAFQFLMTFGGDGTRAMITIESYFSFFLTTTIVFGAAFELPLVIVLLGMIGVVNAKLLREKRRFAVVILAGITAVITPPDLASMVMLLVPMCILYEISIIVVSLIEKKRAV